MFRRGRDGITEPQHPCCSHPTIENVGAGNGDILAGMSAEDFAPPHHQPDAILVFDLIYHARPTPPNNNGHPPLPSLAQLPRSGQCTEGERRPSDSKADGRSQSRRRGDLLPARLRGRGLPARISVLTFSASQKGRPFGSGRAPPVRRDQRSHPAGHELMGGHQPATGGCGLLTHFPAIRANQAETLAKEPAL